MKLKKRVSVVMVLFMVLNLFPVGIAQGQDMVGFQPLFDVEMLLYGQVKSNAISIMARLEQAEIDVYGKVQPEGSLIVRMERLARLLTLSGIEGSLVLQISAIEWMIYHNVTQGLPILERINLLETAIYGMPMTDQPITERVNRLIKAFWPGGTIKTSSQSVSPETFVKVTLLSEVNSAVNKIGDIIKYKVSESLIIDDCVLIPSGTEGLAKVTDVTVSGRWGRDGRVMIDWGELKAIDGTPVKITVGEKATERNTSLQLATGATIAGLALLGPFGAISGILVTGQEHVIPAGTTFFAEIAREVTIRGLSLGQRTE
jgi:hypothetical protein